MPEADSETIQPFKFDVILYPHRSLKPEHFSRLLLILIAICTLASFRFIAVGAWPVVIFLGLDIVALWFAFWINYRRARICETVRLTDSQLIIERTDQTGHTESWTFEPYWTHVRLREGRRQGLQLHLSQHGQQVRLGKFLAPYERRDLYEALSAALYKWKNRPMGAVP